MGTEKNYPREEEHMKCSICNGKEDTTEYVRERQTAEKTPCPSAPVRWAPVAYPVNKFAEIDSPVPNYASPAYK